VVELYKNLVFNGFCDPIIRQASRKIWEKRFPPLLDWVSATYRKPLYLVFIFVEDKFYWKKISMVGEEDAHHNNSGDMKLAFGRLPMAAWNRKLPSFIILSHFSKDFCLHVVTECY